MAARTLDPTAPISGHVYLREGKLRSAWYAKWRDQSGQHQKRLGPAWTGKGAPMPGFLREREAKAMLAEILVEARRGVVRQERTGVTFRDVAEDWFEHGRFERDQLKQRGHHAAKTQLVFVSRDGTNVDGSALRRRYHATLDAAGLRRLRFHDLRHTFGSLAINVASIVQVQVWMGHADIKTTMRYLHHKSRADDARLLSAAFETRSAQDDDESDQCQAA